jgi:DNA modification methylase
MSDIKSKNITMVDVDSIVPNPKNANRHSIEQIKRLEKLIKFQGFRNPLIVSNRTGFLVVGHGRLEAAKNIGMQEVPVIYQDFENESQEYSYLISDNEIARWAELDKQSLYDNLKEIEIDDIELLGIEEFEIPNVEVLDPQTDEDEVPEVEHPITRRGDIWLLGKHRLMCGDSTMIDDVEKLINKTKIDLVFTDPPYNVAFNGRSGKHDVIKNDKLNESDFKDFIEGFVSCLKVIDPKDYYIWCNWKFYGLLQDLLDYKSCIVWAKNVFGLGNNYRHQHEFCLFNGNIDSHIKNESDLWNIKKDSNYIHPTQKPVELSVRAFSNHIKSLNVLDFFGGSGSTLIGAEQTGRNAFLMELDEKYCDVIINRWMNYTGKKATLELTGQTYEQLKKERENA